VRRDGGVAGEELTGREILGDLAQRSHDEHGEADGKLPLAVLTDGVGDHLARRRPR